MAAPTVGCPAKGNSAPGVKIRSRAVWSGLSGGRTNTVSERFISLAMRCMVSPSRPLESMKTASGLPPKIRSLKTSAVRKRWSMAWISGY